MKIWGFAEVFVLRFFNTIYGDIALLQKYYIQQLHLMFVHLIWMTVQMVMFERL